MKASTNKKWDVLFLALLIGVFFLYGYNYILFLRPQSIHQWRQCDCLSIALNYYKNGMHFFSPAVHWCGPTGDNKTCTSEFPWLYYTVAALWKIFGYHESIYRLVELLISFTGIYFLYKLGKEVLKDEVWAMIVAMLLLVSPIDAYYTNNFITDVPALSLAIIAWYYFVRYYKAERKKWLIVSMFFFMLAGLTKISALLSFVPLGFIYLIELVDICRFKIGEHVFKHKGLAVILFLVVIGSIAGWSYYAIAYNEVHNKGLFSTGLLPIWANNASVNSTIFFRLKESLKPEFCNAAVFNTTIALFVLLLVFNRRVSRFLLCLTVAVFIGVVTYILLWVGALDEHDYYLLNLLIFIPIVFISSLHTLKATYVKVFQSEKLKIVCALFIVFCLFNTAIGVRMKYVDEPLVKYTCFSPDIQGLQKLHREYTAHMQALETITPYLRSLGIKDTDKVISIPDPSINISLYLMDQKGFSEYGYDFHDSNTVKKAIKLGARYLVVNDTNYSLKSFEGYIVKGAGVYRNVKIYALKNL